MTQPNDFSSTDILEFPMISRIRRNHGLEHATLHILANYLPNTMFAGHSDMGGFWIIGDVPPETLQVAVQDAMTRLRAGDKRLAIHPNCGTNYKKAPTSLKALGRSSQICQNRLQIANPD